MQARVLHMFARPKKTGAAVSPWLAVALRAGGNRCGMTGEIPHAVFFRLLTNRHVVIFSVGFRGRIAQLVERLVRNEKARGSNPLTSTSMQETEVGGQHCDRDRR